MILLLGKSGLHLTIARILNIWNGLKCSQGSSERVAMLAGLPRGI